jgi:Tol biopolymer transport system component
MIGTKLANYEIVSHLGSGGMGDVYQATDSKLGRSVAVKFLPESFSNDPDRLARFEREARVLASLNHPNIAAIYGLENADDKKFLVMELVPGETLAERIKRGPIPFDEAMEIAIQIAEALEAAHGKGIIHRDLKPANIKVTEDDKVKVLDFGLAKALDQTPSRTSMSDSPTISIAASNVGVILGTAAYMSPEQARGKAVDTRADIWAFGVVLYELLTGKRLFEGEDLTETLASVVKEHPRLDAVPERVRRLLAACLQKDPKKRLQSIGDMRLLIEPPETAATELAPHAARWLWPAIAVVALLGLAVLGAVHFRESPAADSVLRLSVPLPEGASLLGHLALSPDGRRLAAQFSRNGWTGLWVRSLDGTEWTRIDSTRNARAPFWSADSRFLGFFADGKLKIVPAVGGPSRELCDETGLGGGGSWSRGNIILFAGVSGPLRRVSASGGECTAVTANDPNIRKSFPEFLPDGKHYLYVGAVAGDMTRRGVYAASLDDPIGTGLGGKKVLDDFSSVVYAAPMDGESPGHLLFLRGSTLMAQPFNAAELERIGDPFPLANQASFSFSGTQMGASVAQNGTLVYLANRFDNFQLMWIDRTGRQRTNVGSPAEQRAVSLSRDGSLATALRRDEGLHLYDLARNSEVRFSTDNAPSSGMWSPDSTELAFSATVNGVRGIYRKSANGSGKEEMLLASQENIRPSDWSRGSDGNGVLVYTVVDPKTNADIWYLMDPKKPDSKPVKFLGTSAIESQGQLSPDGHWMAYTSNETGRNEVYLRQFPSGEGFAKISVNGGREPRWSKSDSELYYIELSERGNIVTAVSLATDGRGGLRVGKQEQLFDFQALSFVPELNNWLYSPHPDGQRFLVSANAEKETPAINVITNWRNAAAASPQH